MPPNYINKTAKRCNGPLHKGKYIPLDQFWLHKRGKRKGKPFSQCRSCLNYTRWGNTHHGLVPYKRVAFVFEELVNRLGKAETCRRLGVSHNFFHRRNRGHYENIRVSTVVRAMKVLQEARKKGEVRHKSRLDTVQNSGEDRKGKLKSTKIITMDILIF